MPVWRWCWCWCWCWWRQLQNRCLLASPQKGHCLHPPDQRWRRCHRCAGLGHAAMTPAWVAALMARACLESALVCKGEKGGGWKDEQTVRTHKCTHTRAYTETQRHTRPRTHTHRHAHAHIVTHRHSSTKAWLWRNMRGGTRKTRDSRNRQS